MPIEECDEPLIDLRDDRRLLIDTRLADPAGHFAHVRAGVAERLARAADSTPNGRRLLVIEGYRSPALQRRYFREYSARLAVEHPDWPAAEIRTLASRFVSPPEDVPPHSTGGAVDVTLVDARGVEVDLGTPYDADPGESGGRCYTDATGLRPAARENRRVLVRLMRDAGFVNYPTEWWHWSFGDRYWAYVQGCGAARYGTIEP